MNKAFSSILLFFICLPAIHAGDYNSTPGKLSSLMQDDKNITRLKITGTMDVRDFKFIADSLLSLQELDLSGVTIEAYNSLTAYFGSKIKYEANTLPHLCMFGKEYTSVILPDNLKSIDEGALACCKNLQYINLPTSLEIIGEYAFYECETIRSVTIPGSVSNINNFAFSKCKNLEKLTINNGKELSIENYAFSKCPELKDIKLPDNLKLIGSGAFSLCKNINSVTFPVKLEYINEEAFMGTSIVEVDLSRCNLLRSIGEWSFADNKKLESVVLPEALESLGEGAFFYDTALQKVIIPDNISKINDFLFSKCSAMDSEKILPENITEIGNYAFYNWSNLSKFYFPASIEKIGNNAFEGSKNVSMFTIQAVTPPELGENVFAGINQPVIPLLVLENSVALYKNALQWKEFKVTSEIGSVTTTGNRTPVKIFFIEKTLCIEAPADIKEVVLYDPSGIILMKRNPGTPSVRMETDNYTGKLYVVSVLQDDDTRSNYKLIRE